MGTQYCKFKKEKGGMMDIFFSKLKDKVGLLEEKERQLARRIGVLECPHTETEFVRRVSGFMCTLYSYIWQEQCTVCGKVLRTLDSEADFKKARIIKLKNQIKELEKENGNVE